MWWGFLKRQSHCKSLGRVSPIHMLRFTRCAIDNGYELLTLVSEEVEKCSNGQAGPKTAVEAELAARVLSPCTRHLSKLHNGI